MPCRASVIPPLRQLLLTSVLGCFLASGVQAGVGTADHANEPKGVSSRDWSSIRAAYDAGRHAIAVSEDGARLARNPGQQWRARFDGRGFIVTPDAGDWTWGLELRRVGFTGSRSTPGMSDVKEAGCRADPAQRYPPHRRARAGTCEQPPPILGIRPTAIVSHQHGRVHYDWSPTLREWFVNDARGLQQGWTLDARPSPGDGSEPLRLELAVRGGLLPRVSADERAVAFIATNGSAALNFSGLQAWDADGKALAARFEQAGDATLRVAVDESDARYPITIDPIAQQAYLKASNTGAGDLFGHSVAVSGDTVVVAAPAEASSATGVDGNQGDNSVNSAGAAYVFVRNGTGWIQQAYLKASNTDLVDYFGLTVAVSGDTVVVGAPGERSNATGIDGNQGDNSQPSAGAAYVFTRSGSSWTQQAYLKASNTASGDRFGWSVAVSGDTVVVGAEGEASSATGVDGNQGDNNASSSGAAYVFVRSGAVWAQQAYLKASNTERNDLFGTAVALSADTLVVGAYDEDSNATGVDGNQGNNSAQNAGAAYVFVRNGTSWAQQAYLKASNTEANSEPGYSVDKFGFSVAVSDDTVVVGAPHEDSVATGVDGNQGDNSAFAAGAAYVFVRSGATWSQQAYLKASNTETNQFENSFDEFGASVAVSGDTVVVGAMLEDSIATGTDGNQADNSAASSGAAYVFARSGSTWAQRAYLKASNTQTQSIGLSAAHFGSSVAVADDTVVLGAMGEGSNATGVDGNQADNSARDAGAAYVFLVPGGGGTSFMVSNADRFGEPSSGLAGVTVTLFGATSPSPVAVTDAQGVATFSGPAIDPALPLDIRLERDQDRRAYQGVRLDALATTPLVLPRGLRSLLRTKLDVLQATTPLVLPYETAPARSLMDEWNTLQAEPPATHVARDHALGRLLVAGGGLAELYGSTEPLAQDTAKLTVDVVTSALALRKLLAELQAAAAAQGADLLAEGFTEELARHISVALALLLKAADVGVGALQSTVIDAVRSVLPGWAVELLDGAIGATTKGVLDGFASGAWSNQDARKGVLESVVTTLAPKIGGSLLTTAYVVQTQSDLSLAMARAMAQAGTGTVVDAFTASQTHANFVVLRNDEVLSLSTLVAGTAKGWSTAADFFLIVGKVPAAQIATGAGTIVKSMCVGGLVVVAVNDYVTLFDTAFDDVPLVAGRAFDPTLMPASPRSALDALRHSEAQAVVPMAFLVRLDALRDRVSGNDRAAAIDQAEALLFDSDGLDAAVDAKLLQLLAVTAGSGRPALESAHRATLAAAGVLAAERMKLYAALAGYIVPEFAETGATDAGLVALIDVVAQAIMDFETAAANADSEAAGLVAAAFVVVPEHGLADDPVFGRAAPGPIVLSARVVNAGEVAADGIGVTLTFGAAEGAAPVVSLSSPASQLLGTLAPGEARLVTWNASADSTPTGTGSTATYAILVTATSGRTRSAVGGFEVTAPLEPVFSNGFEQ